MSPSRARRVCGRPRCPNLAEAGGYCAEHKPASSARHHAPGQAEFYGSTHWKKLRALVKREEPICRICRVNPTTTVDHIDGQWTHGDRSNLQGLCADCEKTKTGKQHRAKHNGGGQPPPATPTGWVFG